MSYNNYDRSGGQRRQRGGGDRRYSEREQYSTPSPDQRIRSLIIKLGEGPEFDPQLELPHVATQLQENLPGYLMPISEAFRTGVTEQPFKIPYYASLLSLLTSESPPLPEAEAEAAASTSQAPGKAVLDEFLKFFQEFLDKLAWRDLRTCIHFFAHLTLSGTISPASTLDMLQSFTAVLDEPGVSYARARNAALCAGEGVIRAGPVLYEYSPKEIDGIISSIQTLATSSSSKSLVTPLVYLHSNSPDTPAGTHELLECLVSSLQTLQANSFVTLPPSLPHPHDLFPKTPSSSQYELRSILVPPEVIDMDDSGVETSEKQQDEMPSCFLGIYDDELTPSPPTPSSFVLRSLITDVVNVFEVNRKECARILLELPRWCGKGTFRQKSSTTDGMEEDMPAEKMDWVLENTIIETILHPLLLLPSTPHKTVYYHSLITDLAKASPQTVGPAVGKSFRKLYSLVGEGLDVECSKRFAEWFAIHMSNFGFNWVWKEWAPDLFSPIYSPKRALIRRIIELEIRLSYHDRVLKSLPEAFQDKTAEAISESAPGPEFEYDKPEHAYHEAAQSLLTLVKGRSNAEEVIQHAETLRSTLSDSHHEASPDSILRDITIQVLLHVGSRSFSHFLNAIERYLSLLRSITRTSEDRADILVGVAKFWERNWQMVGIVLDKLMQYQIVDPGDIVGWVFARSTATETTRKEGIDDSDWEILTAALDKATGRVAIAKRKVVQVRKEEDDVRSRDKARAAGTEDGSMDVDTETKDATSDSPALVTALKAYTSLTREQKVALSRTLEGFVALLSSPSGVAASVMTEAAWERRKSWSQEEWGAWETWGWYRQFVRGYSAQLSTYVHTLEANTILQLKVEGKNGPAVEMLKSVWNAGFGRDV